MSLAQSLLPEYDHELATTRRLLERVPEAEFGWKPHAKSMSLGQLAGHIANMPFWLSATMNAAFYDLTAGDKEATLEPPVSREELVRAFDEKVRTARASLAKATDAEMMAPWALRHGGHEIFSMPRVAVVRSFVMNHLIHHRGQLSVYLRLKDVPLPPIYGPSADEQ
ncbi:MAG TPA: DinB family protein [Vicinamibacterales bacterium]|nr:DinB family protein [Vicinamibacterales bacterium]